MKSFMDCDISVLVLRIGNLSSCWDAVDSFMRCQVNRSLESTARKQIPGNSTCIRGYIVNLITPSIFSHDLVVAIPETCNVRITIAEQPIYLSKQFLYVISTIRG